MAETILVCDDEKHMLRLLEFNLSKTGCRILTASSGQEVLERIEDVKPDLLIIDVLMPGIDGFETVERLRELDIGQNLPVIILTGRGQSNTQEKADALGVAGFLTKPFSPMRLKSTVEDVLGRTQSD